MGIVFRQSIKTTIITFTGAILGAVAIIQPYIFSLEKLGYYRTLISQGAILQFIVLMGMGNTFTVYISRYDEQKRKAFISFGLLIPPIFTFLFSIPYFLFRDRLLLLYQVQDREMVNQYYSLLPVLVLFWGYLSLFESYLVTQLKVALSVFAREILLRLANIIILILYYYKLLSFSMFLYSSVLAYIIPLILLVIIAVKTKQFGISGNLKALSKQDYKEVIHFSWYHLLLGASMTIMIYIDSLLLGILYKNGLSSLAVYSTAVYIITIMVIPYRSMAISTFPILNNAMNEKDMVKVEDIFHRSSVNILIMAFAMFLLIVCNLHNLVVLLPKSYEAVGPIATILMLGRIVDMATGMNNELISISNLYKFNFRISVLLLASVILFDFLFIPKYGFYGAAWAATLSFSIFNIIKMIFLWEKMNIQPFSKYTLRVFAAAIIAFFIGYYLPLFINPYLDTIFRTIIILFIYGILLFWFNASIDLRTYLKFLVTNKKLF